MVDLEDLTKIDRHVAELLSKPVGWRDDLRSVVSFGFTHRSWHLQTPPQSIDELVDVIDGMHARQIQVTAEHGWLRGTLGVVTNTCTWPELGTDDVQVIRVYTNHSGQWLCEYWQETRYHRPHV
jgi:hypothetical protein